MKFIKTNYLLIILVPILTLISSCGNGEEYDNTLLYWSSNNTHEIEFAEHIVKEWNKKNPNSFVKHQPVPEGQSSEEIILAAVVGKTTPDIYSNMWQGDVELYAQSGILIPLDTLDGFLEFIYDRCDSAAIEEVTSSDGHIYQIPWKINPIMMIYNVNLLKQMGLSGPPKTYSEFFAASEKFKADTDGDGYIDRWFGYSDVIVTWWQRFFDFYPMYLAASGGAPLIKDNKAAFNNEYAISTFRFFRTLYENKYFAQERLGQRRDVFLGSIIAIKFTGAWEIAHAERFKPEGFEYKFSNVPIPDKKMGPTYTYGDPKNIVIFNTCKDPEKAWKFLQNMINQKNDLLLFDLTAQLPRRKDLTTNPVFVEFLEANPNLIPFAEQSKYIRGTDATPVLKEVFDIISQEYEACVVYGTKEPEEAIQDAADAVNLLFYNK